MSLQDFRMPKLADKHAAEAKEAEGVREKLEKKDEKTKKIIKKVSSKKR